MSLLALIFIIAALAHGVARWRGWPLIPLLLTGGFISAIVVPHEAFEARDEVMELALTFLMFTVGLELNPQRMRIAGKSVLWVAFAQFSALGLLGGGMALALGFNGLESCYVGLAISISSTLVVIRHLSDAQQLFEPVGRLVTGVLLIQDAIMIACFAVLANSSHGPLEAALGLGKAVIMASVAVGAQKWICPRLSDAMRNDPELLLLATLALLSTFLLLAQWWGLPPLVGAFFAGFALAKFPINGIAQSLLRSFSTFFGAIFFILLGSTLSIPTPHALGQAIALSALVIVVTPPIVSIVAERCGYSARAALESGLYLAQISEFALILGFMGLQLGHISSDVYHGVATAMVITMTLTPVIARASLTDRILHMRSSRAPRSDSARKDHVIMLGFGAGGAWIYKPLKQAGHDILVIDDDIQVIHQLKAIGVDCLRGDAANRHTLAAINADKAKLIIANLRRPLAAIPALKFAKGVPALVRVSEDWESEKIQSYGGIPVSSSDAALELFESWFETFESSRSPSA